MDDTQTAIEDAPPGPAYKPRKTKTNPSAGRVRKTTTTTTTTTKTPTRPVKLKIDTGAYEALMIHSLRDGKSMSKTVTGLIKQHLNATTDPSAAGRVRKTAKTTTTSSIKLMIETDAYEALVIHSLRDGKSMSETVTGLIKQHLTQWTIQGKPGPKPGAGS